MKKYIFVVAIVILGWIYLSCGRNPVKPHSPHPEHPVHPSHPVIPSEFIICNLVDLTVAGDVIIDKSSPNIYAFKRNGIEEARAVLDTTTANPTIITITHTFKDYNLLSDLFSIVKVEGSRAEIISVGITKIKCLEQ